MNESCQRIDLNHQAYIRIPHGWSVSKIKYVCSIFGRIGFRGYTKEDLVDAAQGALALGAKHIDDNAITLNDPVFISWNKYYESPEIIVNKNDIVFVQRGSLGKVALVDKDIGLATINPSLVLLKNSILEPKYLYYQLISNLIQQNVKLIESATAVPMISQEQLSNFRIVQPPLPTQHLITRFLDHKTSRIDGLIRKTEQKIALLNEYRTALINHVVTKGLTHLPPEQGGTKGVKMKDSGIEGIGEIPVHWQIKKLKFIGSMKSGDFISAEDINVEGDYPVLGGNGLRGYTSSYTHEGDYVLIGRQGALCGNVNYATDKFWATEHAVVVSRLNDENVIWLGELLRSMNLNRLSVAAAQPGLSIERIKELSCPYPDRLEQNAIGDFIRSTMETASKTIEQSLNTITLLKEYRQSLISLAVTGKIDVSNYGIHGEKV